MTCHISMNHNILNLYLLVFGSVLPERAAKASVSGINHTGAKILAGSSDDTK